MCCLRRLRLQNPDFLRGFRGFVDVDGAAPPANGPPAGTRERSCRTTILDYSRSIGYNLCVAKNREKLSDQIRRAVDASGLSRYRICKTLGLGEATMSRFMNRQGGLSMQTLDALAELLRLNIAADTRKGR